MNTRAIGLVFSVLMVSLAPVACQPPVDDVTGLPPYHPPKYDAGPHETVPYDVPPPLCDPETTGVPDYTSDGQFTGWKVGTELSECAEWGAVTPAKGKFGYFYVTMTGDSTLHFLNDWVLRTDKPICKDMYNLFRFSTGYGDHLWEVRVYGDARLTVLHNGQPFSGGLGGYSFGPSPNLAAPHTQFEFELPNLEGGGFASTQCDPVAPYMSQVAAEAANPEPGCFDPDGALVTDPVVVQGELLTGGADLLAPATGAVVVTLVPSAARPPALPVDYYKVVRHFHAAG
jgi:hypothetical protein